MKVLIDTNVLIDFYRSKRQREKYLAEQGVTEYAISTATYIEFLGGAKLKYKRAALKFLAEFKVISFSARTQALSRPMCEAIELKPKGSPDILIAAVAKEKGYAVITENIADFERLGVPILPYKRALFS